MKRYTYLLIFPLLVVITSCNDDSDCCLNVPLGLDIVSFSVFSESQSDLLDPNSANTLNTSKIRILEKDTNGFIEIYEPNLDSPYGFSIYDTEDVYQMKLYLSKNNGVDSSINRTALIKWNESISDTINIDLVRESRNIIRVKKIFYNSEKVYDENLSEDNIPYFKVVK